MALTIVEGNPAPPRATELAILTADRLSLRTVRWQPEGEPRGTVVIAQGRAEFVEKYFEVATELLNRGFAVVAFDWRGQGASTRQLADPRKGHVPDFRHYQRDLATLHQGLLAPFMPRPWFALGHSMGAAILLEAAHDGVLPFERMVLSAPMIDIAAKLRPRGARLLASALAAAGLRHSYVPGGNHKPLQARPFAGNPLTSDRERYGRSVAVLERSPLLGLGAPSIGWIDAAFKMFTRFAQPTYATAIVVPTFIVNCGRDELVDANAAERLAVRLKTCRHVMLQASRHEILMEKDAVRERFWAAFDAFVPGRARLEHRQDQRPSE